MYSQDIVTLHDQLTKRWKSDGVHTELSNLAGLIEQNHSFNYQLWHAEDKARRDDKGAEFVYQAKRQIDRFNQQRNNAMEAIDQWCLQQHQPTDDPDCAIHSETPGMMIDRLSILCLKIFHMQLQVDRTDASSAHRQQCREKLAVLNLQRDILARCLDQLFLEVDQGKRRFIVYQQFKMYNDPNLNPELYRRHTEA
ncbi:DUF4254 domain-containing protein [Legionella sp. W05-934-2]|uniref:DUF4254 domain-containing protein n=1 Tax=Legionella sp. W05-934-2 TaxID=1198649 RepID=UPI0034629501